MADEITIFPTSITGGDFIEDEGGAYSGLQFADDAGLVVNVVFTENAIQKLIPQLAAMVEYWRGATPH